MDPEEKKIPWERRGKEKKRQQAGRKKVQSDL